MSMTVYKGTNKDMVCTCGKGQFQYILGQKMTAEKSMVARTGLHANEYILDCMKWYSLDTGRFFRCTAGGSITEQGESQANTGRPGEDTKLSCTELTLDWELSHLDIVREAVIYMLEHPARSWERSGLLLDVCADHAKANCAGAIAIARGTNPKVTAVKGAAVGLVEEGEDGGILAVRCFYAMLPGTNTYELGEVDG